MQSLSADMNVEWNRNDMIRKKGEIISVLIERVRREKMFAIRFPYITMFTKRNNCYEYYGRGGNHTLSLNCAICNVSQTITNNTHVAATFFALEQLREETIVSGQKSVGFIFW